MKIEEENADLAYNGLVLGPNKPEPIVYAALPAPSGPETTSIGLKQSTLQAPVEKPVEAVLEYLQQQQDQAKNASQDTFKSIEDDVK